MATLNLANLCHTYFLKRPKFMSIDIEGVNYLPLSTNDWNNEKCVPEMIYAEVNIYSEKSGFPDIGNLLIQHNY